ncbi:hypothetical protein [Pseudomonas koreensis]|uniref:hypothetical protein n=1 Tax=Pseudomonas koreensis TaxID=198620 RepID=UPI003D95A6B2
MHAFDDFRFKAHEHLIDLEATTNQLMQLVVSDDMTGKIWDDTLSRHKCSFSAWIAVADSRACQDVPAIDEKLIDQSFSNNFLKPSS